MISKLHLSHSRVSDNDPAALSYLRGDLYEFKAAGKQQASAISQIVDKSSTKPGELFLHYSSCPTFFLKPMSGLFYSGH